VCVEWCERYILTVLTLGLAVVLGTKLEWISAQLTLNSFKFHKLKQNIQLSYNQAAEGENAKSKSQSKRDKGKVRNSEYSPPGSE
jgi:hypothetical protein